MVELRYFSPWMPLFWHASIMYHVDAYPRSCLRQQQQQGSYLTLGLMSCSWVPKKWQNPHPLFQVLNLVIGALMSSSITRSLLA